MKNRPRQLAASRGRRQDLLGGVAVAPGERGVGGLGDALDTRQSRRIDRLSEWDLVRATRRFAPVAFDERSTAIFAIRRHVVSLPPVIVISPLEVS